MFHSGMGVGPFLIMGLIISAVIGFGSEDIKGFIGPMALFSIAALSDLFAENKELEKENKALKRNDDFSYIPKIKRRKKKKKRKKTI